MNSENKKRIFILLLIGVIATIWTIGMTIALSKKILWIRAGPSMFGHVGPMNIENWTKYFIVLIVLIFAIGIKNFFCFVGWVCFVEIVEKEGVNNKNKLTIMMIGIVSMILTLISIVYQYMAFVSQLDIAVIAFVVDILFFGCVLHWYTKNKEMNINDISVDDLKN
jgi:hypothetical protein